MSARRLPILVSLAALLLALACGQQLVDFALAGADLGPGDLAGADLVGADLAGADLAGTGPMVDFAGVDFAGADLSGVDLFGFGDEDLAFPLDLAGDMSPPCRALQLDGVHAIVTAAPQSFHNPGGAFTVEGWVYQTARTDESVVVGHWGDTANGTASYLLSIDATGRVVLRFSLLGSSASSVTSTATVPLSTWTHVAGVFVPNALSATLTVYINGTSPTTASIGPALFPASTSGVPLHIGRYSTASPEEKPFTGFLHDVRVSSVARYPAQGAPPVRLLPDAQTIALYHFDESGGSNAADASIHGVPGALLQNAIFGVPPVCP